MAYDREMKKTPGNGGGAWRTAYLANCWDRKARHSLSYRHSSNIFLHINGDTVMWTTVAAQIGVAMVNRLGEEVIGAVITYFARRR